MWALAPLLGALVYFLDAKKCAPVRRIILETDLLTKSLTRIESDPDEQLEENRMFARTVFARLVEYIQDTKTKGMPIAVIDIKGGYNEILGNIEAKDVYEHLSEGLCLEDVFMSKEGTEKIMERREPSYYYRTGGLKVDSDSDTE